MEISERVAFSCVIVGCLTLLFLNQGNGQSVPFSNGTEEQTKNILLTPGLNSTTIGPKQYVSNNTSTEPTTLPPPQRPPPALGLACNESSQCKANFSSCLNNLCTCQSGYISSRENLICLKVVTRLGDSCSEDSQCSQELNKTVGPTTCLNFICSCAIGMSLIGDKCQGPTVLNSKCSSDDDCLIKRSSCKENMCLCRDGFVPNSENNMCLPINMRLMKEMQDGSKAGCSEDVQCQELMGDNAICVVGSDGGSCTCTPATHHVRSTCIPYKDLGADCSFDEECITKDVNTESESSRICNQNRCSCNSGWTQVDSICTGGASENSLAGALVTLILFLWFLREQ